MKDKSKTKLMAGCVVVSIATYLTVAPMLKPEEIFPKETKTTATQVVAKTATTTAVSAKETESIITMIVKGNTKETDASVPSTTETKRQTTTEQTKTTTSPATVQEKKEIDDDDLFCLVAAMYREAGGESAETKMMVGNVILNRVNSSLFPNSIRGVLEQPYQYGLMWRDGISLPSGADDGIVQECRAIAKRILSGERVLPSNVVFQAEFVQGSGVYTYSDGMYFCYL